MNRSLCDIRRTSHSGCCCCVPKVLQDINNVSFLLLIVLPQSTVYGVGNGCHEHNKDCVMNLLSCLD